MGLVEQPDAGISLRHEKLLRVILVTFFLGRPIHTRMVLVGFSFFSVRAHMYL